MSEKKVSVELTRAQWRWLYGHATTIGSACMENSAVAKAVAAAAAPPTASEVIAEAVEQLPMLRAFVDPDASFAGMAARAREAFTKLEAILTQERRDD